MRVLFAGGGTGGHLLPALRLADALREVVPEVEPVLVGAERGIEARLLPDREPRYRYYLLPTEPLYRGQWWRNAAWLGLAPRLIARCRAILRNETPRLAVGTGGYAAGPILFLAHRRGVPIALQEQNAFPGITTRLLAPRARQVHLGFPEAEARLRLRRGTEVYALGNPVPAPPAGGPDREAARRALGIADGAGVVFVMGGSQGARAINELVASVLDRRGLADLTLLWSTGHGTWERYRGYHDPPSRQVRPFWTAVADAYAAADVVVSRAGAMTTAEVTAWGLPSILIPLPTAAADHQTANARALAGAGAAVHLPEGTLDGASFEAALRGLLGDPRRLRAMGAAARRRGRPEAARRIAETLAGLLRGETLS